MTSRGKRVWIRRGLLGLSLALGASLAGVRPAPAGAAAATPKPARLSAEAVLPEETLLYFSLEDLALSRTRYARTALAAVRAEPEVATYVKGIEERLAAFLALAPELQALKEVHADLKRVCTGQVALALTDLGPQRLGLALFAPAADATAAQRLLDRLAALAPQSQAVKTPEGATVRMLSLPLPPDAPLQKLTLAFSLHQGAVYLTLAANEAPLREMLRRAARGATSAAGSLGANAEYLKARARLGQQPSEALVFCRAAEIVKRLLQLGKANEQVTAVVEALGLRQCRTLVWGVIADPPGYRAIGFAELPGARKGLWRLLGQEPLNARSFALAPQESAAYAGLRVNPAPLIEIAREVALASGQLEEPQQFEALIEQANQALGMNIEDDLIAALGNEVSFAILPGGNALFSGADRMLLSVAIRDRAKFERCFNVLLQLARTEVEAGGAILFRDWEYRGRKFYTFVLPTIFHPTVALLEDRLLVCLTPQGARRAVELLDAPGRTIASERGFLEALRRTGGRLGPGVIYENPGPRVGESLAAMELLGAFVVPAFTGREGGVRGRALRAQCASNLHQCGLALIQWSQDNANAYPEKLEDLFPEYIPDKRIMVCADHPRGPNFSYVSGLRSTDRPSYITVFEPLSNHGGEGANALFIDCHAEWLSAERLKTTLDRQMQELAARGRQVQILGPAPDAPAGPAAGPPGLDPEALMRSDEFKQLFASVFDPVTLPNPECIARHLFPSLIVETSEPDGLMLREYSCSGTGILSLFVVPIAVGGVAAASVVAPNLMRNKMEANHTAAAASLRQILSGQSTFHKGDYDGNLMYDYAPDYSDLYYIQKAGQEIKLIDKALADADDDGGNGIPKSGYLFDDLVNDVNGQPYDNRYECGICAWPAEYNKTGLYTYVIDITGSVYCSDLGSGAPLTDYPDIATWLLVH